MTGGGGAKLGGNNKRKSVCGLQSNEMLMGKKRSRFTQLIMLDLVFTCVGAGWDDKQVRSLLF